jgi:hypothetical protein
MEGAMQQAAQRGRQIMGRDYIRASLVAADLIGPKKRHVANPVGGYRIRLVRKITHNSQIGISGVTAMSASITMNCRESI